MPVIPLHTGRYVLNSVAATATDFLVYGWLLRWHSEPVLSALSGNIAGASASFLLLHHWVFKDAEQQRWHRKLVKFASGVAIVMATNALVVGVLYHWLGMDAWPARITAAVTAWGTGYWFNRNIVFEKRNTSAVSEGVPAEQVKP
jgi:putative flippase GtrA